MIDFLNHTTYPNIREGLRVFVSFLTSGHTKVKDYILREQYRQEQNKSHQVIPLHEFIKSIALQNRHYFNSEISVIYNIFIPPLDSTDHFQLYILIELSEQIKIGNYTSRFISNRAIIDKLNILGYGINNILNAISDLLKASLVDTDKQLTDIDWIELPAEFNISLTAKGYYYLNELLNRFHYYDLVLQDCPIYSKDSFDKIKGTFAYSREDGTRNLESRKACVKEFLSYLKEKELMQGNQILAVYGNIMNSFKKMVLSEIDQMKSPKENYSES